MSINQSERTFRQSKRWKEFRRQLIKDRGPICELCGAKSKKINVHHKDPDHYEDLTPSKFVLLCPQCHRPAERIWAKIQRGVAVPNREQWIALLEKYFGTTN